MSNPHQITMDLSVGDGGSAVAKVDHPELGTVTVYEYVAPDGERYLVVDVDHESDNPPVRVYVNDAPIFEGDSA